MIRSHRLCAVAALSLLFACDSGEKPKDASAKKGADAKVDADAKDDAKKGADAKVDADADIKKEADTKTAANADAGADAKAGAGEKHFDVKADKSGVLARSAAALEASDALDDENLRELSHHAEKLASFETLCKHEAEVRKSEDPITDCVKAMEHHMVQIGPEVYAQFAECTLAATTIEELDACHAAEAEAEELLHKAPHGDGLGKDVCDELFTHFEKLAMEDAGEQAPVVKEILEEVRADVLITCMEQGSQAEVDCSMNAKTMTELKDCASKLL